jgi:crotonobetainyl-CoA hydratase
VPPPPSTLREIGALMRSEDAKEAPLAFAQKRAPVWQAR